MACKYCKEFSARFRCSAESHGECDCPKCQGYCECKEEKPKTPSKVKTKVKK
jgi:hypothetical protein